jgi:putative lipoic acid-binding regulatory protein
MSDRDSLIEFPCRFPIKAMGRAEPDFESLVVEIVGRHAPGLDAAAVTLRPSSGGRWLAVTVVIEAESRAQLDAIYRDLSGHERVAWAL